jgi:bifunctional non-homologous end joining protein LigD
VTREVRIGGRRIALSSQDKPLFRTSGHTKGDLVAHYRRVAGAILPHLRDRPLTLQIFPGGIEEKGFFQKEIAEHYPDWIARARLAVGEGGESREQILCQDEATLVYLANQNAITLHTWLSRYDRPHHPDRLTFDLDPSGVGFDAVRRAARELREVLAGLGLEPFVMTTGSRGLHVVAPLDRTAPYEASRALAREIAEALAAEEPERYTVAMRKATRGERVFIDYVRNAYGQTAVAPYAVRARPGAPVATPLAWEELEDEALGPQSYTIDNLAERLEARGDPWREIDARAASLEAAAERWRAGGRARARGGEHGA